MKRKLSLVVASLLIAGAMAGCSVEAKSQTSYIDMDHACTAALAAAGISEDDANVISAQLSERDGITYYQVDFAVEDMEYTYSIDAMTGVVIEASSTNQANGDRDDTTQNTAGNGSDVTDYDTVDQGKTANGSTAKTNPFSSNADTRPAPQNGASTEVTLEQAKRTALAHAGKNESEVTFTKTQKSFDDNVWIYEIEFVVQSGNSYQEYDYDISVSTGKILSHDCDVETDTSQNHQSQSSTTKTENEVRNIALAKVPGAKAENCSLWLERDDGRLHYEGKIIYEQMEYEFEIDAYSGTILEWDAESIYDD